MSVLVVEDDRITRLSLTDALEREGYDVVAAEDGCAGMEAARQGRFDVVVTDLRLPCASGIDVLRQVRETSPRCEVILITAYGTVDTAVEALKLGAYDYVTKPLDPEKFLGLLRHLHQYRGVVDENEELRRRLEVLESHTMIGEAPAMRRLLETAHHVAQHDHTVIIEGESGTGKEVLARTLHELSPRREGPFIAINCAAIPETLLESELFGHEKGAFSGAIQRHRGYFERAHRGTIFIDDIDDLPLQPQVKLLRVLQERSFVRLGGSESVEVDVRVICASKVDLLEMVRQKEFREDLYYRLNIVPLRIPPLRERMEDLPLLVRHFLDKYDAPDEIRSIPPDVHRALMDYTWPGNVRELENVVLRLIATGDPRQILPARERHALAERTASADGQDPGRRPAFRSFEEHMRSQEHQIITWALEEAGHNISRAARLLNLPRGTLRSRLAKLDIDLDGD